jgi:PAS domain S-box-containing protein
MFAVLYVDDEPALLEIGTLFLERSGVLQVDTALSAADAIERMKEKRYDGIISDFQMPGMDGIAFLKYIRTHWNQLPFVLFTGRGREEVVIEALNAGANFYLQKGGDVNSQFTELEYKIRLAIELKQTADNLRESQQQMADIINFLPDPTYAVDLNRTIIVWSRAMEETTGVKADEMLGKGNYEYSIPFYGERRPILIDLIFNDKLEMEWYPGIQRTVDTIVAEGFSPALYGGRGAYIMGTASPLYDTMGNVVGAIESIRDITERKRAEEALRESEQRYRNVVEDQTELICRFRPDGTYVFVNEAYCRYFNINREDIIGKRYTIWMPDEDRRLVRLHLRSLTREEPTAIMEHCVLMPDGEVRWQRWSDRAIFDHDGEVIEYQSVGRDITEWKEAEDALKKSEEQLTLKLDSILSPDTELSDLELINIIDAAVLQTLTDDLHRIIHCGFAVLDLKMKIIVASGWQEICLKFHRQHEVCLKNCHESDRYLSDHVKEGECVMYRCKNNMWDAITPLFLGEKHMANIYVGQFFFTDEVPDRNVFIAQAERYGFDQEEYLAALDRVPRWNREDIETLLHFYTGFAEMISQLSYSKLKLARALVEERRDGP